LTSISFRLVSVAILIFLDGPGLLRLERTFSGPLSGNPPVSSPGPSTAPAALPESSSASAISQNVQIIDGETAFRRKNFKKAHDLLQEALLDSGSAGLSPANLLDLASATRHIGHPGRAIDLLLPLLSPRHLPPLSPAERLRAKYELGMADADHQNQDGAVRQILPLFSLLNDSSRIRHSAKLLMDYWRHSDPVSGSILMGQSLGKLSLKDQKAVMTRTISLIFGSVHDEPGLLQILSAFPRDFPGDYAAYRLGMFYFRAKEPVKAERVLLREILSYPESMYIQEAERLLNRLSPGNGVPNVGLILPDLTQPALRPYMRSILTGATLGLFDASGERTGLVVRFVLKNESYSRWYKNLVDDENVVALVGPFLSRDYDSVRERLEKDQLLFLTPTLPADPRTPFMLSMANLPEMNAAAMARFALSLVPSARVAVLYPSDYYGHVFKNSLGKNLEKGGGGIAAALKLRKQDRDDQEVVMRLRGFGDEISVPRSGALPFGVTSRSGDFVVYKGKSYFLVYKMEKADPVFFLPSFDVVAIPNDFPHPFKILDELVYKDIQNVVVIGNETFMASNKTWDIVSDIHNPLYSVAPVNLFHVARGSHSTSGKSAAIFRIRQISGKSPDMLTLQSYDCGNFLGGLLSAGYTTRYHLGVTALSKMTYNGLSGQIEWGKEGRMSRVFNLYRFSGGDWKSEASEKILWQKGS